jgi:hypothetical protein
VVVDENNSHSSEQLASLVRKCLTEGVSVEIDGLGTFVPDRASGFSFQPRNRPKVFVAYVQEDAEAAERLFENLETCGFDPWLDRRKLLPGQNWPRSIEEAISTSDFFLACFSHRKEEGRLSGRNPVRSGLHTTHSAGRDLPDSGPSGCLPRAYAHPARDAVYRPVSRLGSRVPPYDHGHAPPMEPSRGSLKRLHAIFDSDIEDSETKRPG